MALDYSKYTSLSKEDFNLVEPTKVEDLNPSFFKYNKDLNIIICSTCFLTLLNTKDIKKHLIKNHNDYYKNTKDIKEIIVKLESLNIKSYLDLKDIPSNTYYFKDLPLSFNSYLCFKCNFITTSYKILRNHLVNKEGIKNKDNTKRKDIINNIPIIILYPSLNKGLFIPKLPLLEPSLINKDKETTISTISTRSNSISSSRSSSIIDSTIDPSNLFLNYINKKEEILLKAKEIGESTISNKALSSFLKNSRFNLYLENKNIKDLLELIEPINNDSKFNIINSITIKLAYKISSLIPNIIRSIRIDLKKDSILTSFLSTKDFIELESSTKKVYFKVFSDLLIFILRLYLIKHSYIESINKDYITKDIDFSIELEASIKLLIDLDLEDINTKDKGKGIEDNNEDINSKEITFKDIEQIIILIFNNLLKLPIKFTTLKEYTLFKNPIIIFFILNSLNKDTLIYKNERDISNLASKVIYNSKLFFIGYLSV